MIFPILKFQVQENSMEPFLSPGDFILVNRWSYFLKKPKVGDVIIIRATKTEKYFIKRVKKIKKNKCFVLGDNEKESIDSRTFGWVSKKDIVSKMIFKL